VTQSYDLRRLRNYRRASQSEAPEQTMLLDGALHDPVFFAPFAAYFDARIGRPSIGIKPDPA
jgi:hypothetical protein